ncbi:ATP-binding protein [Luedemannella helvata]|uniref:AAA+ ATPase domain-containing protein n=1 Tax=Luedemannella helvata TaxID=349315 RepID=A0ABP4XFQ0_9ACTN
MPNWPQAPRTGEAPDRRPSNPAPAAAAKEQPENTPQFIARKPLRTLDDLIVSSVVMHRIDIALKQLTHHEALYHTWNLKKIDPYRAGTAVNFYGMPGTGKSLAAEALAAQVARPFIDVNYAEIESRYVGDTPKNIVRCFEQARAANAVLVFNEADSILGSRLSNVTQSSDHSVNVSRAVMLSQLDAFDGLVVFTTNFPRNYDAAFVRRILVHVKFELPDLATRERLWAQLIPDEMPREASFSTRELAAASEGLAGGDIVNAIKAAGAEAISRPQPDRHLTMADVRHEIESIRLAKAEVGKPAPGPRVVSVDEVDSVPED